MNQKPKPGLYKETGTRRKKVGMSWIQWIHYTEEEVTWKIETYLLWKLSRLSLTQFAYLNLQFFSTLESRNEILFRGEACDSPGFMG